MLRPKAMLDQRRTGCDLHSDGFGYGREAGEQLLRAQDGEMKMLFLLISCTSNLCKENGGLSLPNYFMILEQVL